MSKRWNEVKEALQEIYPGMTKSVFSMGKNPAYYGVELVERAKRLADVIEPKRENRTNPCRLYLRVGKDMYRAILGRLNGRSFQEYLLDLVADDLKNTPKRNIA